MKFYSGCDQRHGREGGDLCLRATKGMYRNTGRGIVGLPPFSIAYLQNLPLVLPLNPDLCQPSFLDTPLWIIDPILLVQTNNPNDYRSNVQLFSFLPILYCKPKMSLTLQHQDLEMAQSLFTSANSSVQPIVFVLTTQSERLLDIST